VVSAKRLTTYKDLLICMSKSQLHNQNRRYLPKSKGFIKIKLKCFNCGIEIDARAIKGHYARCKKEKI